MPTGSVASARRDGDEGAGGELVGPAVRAPLEKREKILQYPGSPTFRK